MVDVNSQLNGGEPYEAPAVSQELKISQTLSCAYMTHVPANVTTAAQTHFRRQIKVKKITKKYSTKS